MKPIVRHISQWKNPFQLTESGVNPPIPSEEDLHIGEKTPPETKDSSLNEHLTATYWG